MARKEVIQLRCSAEEKEHWREAAEQAHLELSAWIRTTLDRAIRRAPRADYPDPEWEE